MRNKGSNSIKIDNEAINDLRRMIEKSVSRRMQTSSDFIILSGVMWNRIRECISPTTLKRIWGYVKGYETINVHTLDTLARVIGYADWKNFVFYRVNKDSEEESNIIFSSFIRTETLFIGNRVEVRWQPNRHCIFEYKGNYTFEVVVSENSKLNLKDTFKCPIFILNEPLYMDHLIQGEHTSISFVAGKKNGLIFIKLM